MDKTTFSVSLLALLLGTVTGAGLCQLIAVMLTWFSCGGTRAG